MDSIFKVKEGNKYLISTLLALVVFFLGSTIIAYVLAIPYCKIAGVGFNRFMDSLIAFSSTDKFNSITYGKISVEEYFAIYPNDYDNIKVFYSSLQGCSYVALIIMIFYLFRYDLLNDLIDFKNNIGKKIGYVALAILGMFALSYAIGIIYALFGITGESENETDINTLLSGPSAPLMIFAIVIVAPIVEELIFRKLLIGTFEKKFHFNPILSCFISCFIFSFIHVVGDIDSWIYIFQYIALSLPMCLLYHYSGNNICCSILLHIGNNAFSCLVTIITASLILM